jgi:arabinofuranosyltransferase
LIVNMTLLLCDRYLRHKKVNIPLFTLMLMAMVLTRPESLLFGALFIFLLAAQTFFDQGIRAAIKYSFVPAVGFVGTAAALILWRRSYFGYPLPNTYYAKVSGNELDNLKGGFAYLVEFFYNYPHLIFITGILLFYVFILLQKLVRERQNVQLNTNEKVQAILLPVILVGLAAPVLTGGDHFNYSRFYQCIVPLLLIAFFNFPVLKNHVAFVQPHNKAVPAFMTLVIAVMVFFNSKATWVDFMLSETKIGTRIFHDFAVARRGRMIAERLNHTFIDQGYNPSTGIIAAGGYGYIYKGATIDLMGLNNTLMAHASKRKVGPRNHASFDVGAFWKLQPDMVGMFYGAASVQDTAAFTLPDNGPGFRNSFTYEVYKKIFDQPQFIQTYLPALVKLKTESTFLFSYYNKAFLNKLDPTRYDIRLLQRRHTIPTNTIAPEADSGSALN